MSQVLWKDNENLIRVGNSETGLEGLLNEATGEYVNGATVTLVGIKGPDGSYLSGTTNLSMDYVANSDGHYQVSIPETVALRSNKRYLAVITAESGTINARWEMPLVCRIRAS